MSKKRSLNGPNTDARDQLSPDRHIRLAPHGRSIQSTWCGVGRRRKAGRLPDLAAEYNMARAVDIGAGRGLDPGDGVSSMTVRNSLEPAEMLILRARRILSFESEYGRYTVCFAKALKEYWPAVHEWRPLAKTVSAAIAKLQMRCKYVNAVAQ